MGALLVALGASCASEPAPLDAPVPRDVSLGDTGDPTDAAPPRDAPTTDVRVFEGLESGDQVSFALDEAVLGVQLVFEGEGIVGITRVNAAGTLVIEDNAFVGAPYATLLGDGIVAANLPGSDLLIDGVPRGRWEIDVTGSGTLTVRVQPGTHGVFSGGRLDVDLWLPEGLTIGGDAHLLTPETALSDDAAAMRLQAFFEAVSALFGLARGEVRPHRMAAGFASIDSLEELSQVAAATAGASTPSVHLVWTNGIVFEGREVWGVTSGLPGVAARPGTRMSAVVIDVSAGFSAIADGYTMAHEMGHFAGLNHTTELSGTGEDLLSDTPRCERITVDPRACPDATNLMFPIFWGASDGDPSRITSSAAQRRIVAGTLLYRADPSATSEAAPIAPTAAFFRAEGDHVEVHCGTL